MKRLILEDGALIRMVMDPRFSAFFKTAEDVKSELKSQKKPGCGGCNRNNPAYTRLQTKLAQLRQELITLPPAELQKLKTALNVDEIVITYMEGKRIRTKNLN